MLRKSNVCVVVVFSLVLCSNSKSSIFKLYVLVLCYIQNIVVNNVKNIHLLCLLLCKRICIRFYCIHFIFIYIKNIGKIIRIFAINQKKKYMNKY